MTTRETIEQWTSETAMDLISNYTKLGLKASGRWGRDLETKIEESGTKYKITFLGSHYTQQLVSGRQPNKNQSPNSIKAWVGWAGSTFLADWVRDKGLNISPFAVANKIARKGITVPNKFNTGTILSDVFTDSRIDNLLRRLNLMVVDDIRTDIKKVLA